MEQEFYVGRLRDEHGLTVLIPDERERRLVHEVIYRELCVGITEESSRREYRRIMRRLADHGAECVVFGCTEIDLLVGPQDSPVPVFGTTRLHARKAVEVAPFASGCHPLRPPGSINAPYQEGASRSRLSRPFVAFAP